MTLSDLGIEVKSGTYTTTCPRCSHERKPGNRKKPCLTVWNTDPEKAGFNCNNCNFKGRLDNYAKYEKVRNEAKQPKEQATVYSKAITDLLTKKQISPITAAKFGCYERVIFNKPIFCLPYFEGGLVNVKFRKLQYGPDEMKFWLLKKEEHGAKLVYFGMNLLDLDACKDVTIVEGEFDAMTHAQCDRMNVISVPNGAPDPKHTNLENRLSFATDPYIVSILEKAERIYIFTDNDAPGKYLRDLLASIYGKKRCYVTTYPTGYKDSNEIYAGDIDKGLDPLGKAGIDRMYEVAQPYPIEGFYTIKNPVIQDEINKIATNGYNKGLFTGKNHYDDLFRIDNRMVAVLTGIPKLGKTTVFRDYSINLCKNNPSLKLAGFTPEMRPISREYAKMIEVISGKTIIPNRHNTITQGERSAAEDFIHTHYHLINPNINGFADVYGKIDPKTIGSPKGLRSVLLHFKLLKDRYGINGFWIDAWNKLDNSQTPVRQTIDQVVSQDLDYILKFCEENDLFAFIIAHPTKMGTGRGGNPLKPNLYDIKGGSPWNEKVDIGLCVHRPLFKRTDKKDENGDEIWVEDNDAPASLSVEAMRFDELGMRGSVKLYLNKETGRLITEKEKVNGYEEKKEREKKKTVKITSSVPNPTEPLSEQIEESDDDEITPPPF